MMVTIKGIFDGTDIKLMAPPPVDGNFSVFVTFVAPLETSHDKQSNAGTERRYPIVSVPATSLDAWMNLLPEGYEGNALVDTETLYESV